jgi:hypothetical protein
MFTEVIPMDPAVREKIDDALRSLKQPSSAMSPWQTAFIIPPPSLPVWPSAAEWDGFASDDLDEIEPSK